MPEGDVLLSDDFDGYRDGEAPGDDWWVEGGQQVSVENGRLRVKANPEGKQQPGFVCTVWHRTPLSGDIRLSCDTQVLASTIGANNINFFLFYADPEGRDLFETRGEREDAGYAHYHALNGYIFTFLNDFRVEGGPHPDGGTFARYRMRRCPGFELLTETYASDCRPGKTYRVCITRRGGRLAFEVDGRTYLEAEDPAPWAGGLLGLRTFQTDLWWDNIQVLRL